MVHIYQQLFANTLLYGLIIIQFESKNKCFFVVLELLSFSFISAKKCFAELFQELQLKYKDVFAHFLVNIVISGSRKSDKQQNVSK